jgi:hypothetical protein
MAHYQASASDTRPTAATANSVPDTIQADVAHLKDIVPAQSHSMIDVGRTEADTTMLNQGDRTRSKGPGSYECASSVSSP